MRFRPKVFTTRPGCPDATTDGDPTHVAGIEVALVFLRRVDRPAALVRLVDRRFALTGDVVAVGGACDMAAYARRTAHASRAPSDQRWFLACATELLRFHPHPFDHAVEPQASPADGQLRTTTVGRTR